MNASQAQQILDQADLVHSETEIQQAYQKMAAEITAILAETDPLILVVMNGGLIPAGFILPLLNFPFTVDYIHATRYQNEIKGGKLTWIKRPEQKLINRTILIIDDISDEGYTLDAIVKDCQQNRAKQVLSAVLVDKQHSRGIAFKADFIGLEVQDRYVFGCGMDYKGYWRQLKEIYAYQ
jgi:hypoxanthine phosphoribosyltransferase